MVFPKTIWLVIAAALLISSIGFKKYVWFISLGYGFSIAGIGILLLALYGGSLTAGTAICCVLFILYGCRLGGYLLYREVKSSAYNSKMKTEIKDGKSMTFGVKCAIWVTCALLYALQVTPVFYRLANGAGTDAWCIVGAVIMLFGVCFAVLSRSFLRIATRTQSGGKAAGKLSVKARSVRAALNGRELRRFTSSPGRPGRPIPVSG